MTRKSYETLRSEELARQRQKAEADGERAMEGRRAYARTVSNAEALRDCLKADEPSLQKDGYRIELSSGQDHYYGSVIYVTIRAWDDRHEPDEDTGKPFLPVAVLQVTDQMTHNTYRDPGYGARFMTDDVQVAAQYLLAKVAQRGPCRRGSWWERLWNRSTP